MITCKNTPEQKKTNAKAQLNLRKLYTYPKRLPYSLNTIQETSIVVGSVRSFLGE